MFGSSTLGEFRKHLGQDGIELLQKVNEIIMPKLKSTERRESSIKKYPNTN